MNNKPQVSVIIIFLNEEKFIREAVDSVFAQTYHNWELLLVDDGSADGSTAIARQYAEQYRGKVRYLEHKGHQNRGMSASRNLGIRYAQGEYIATLDADDVWLPYKLQQQVAILDSQLEAGMVYGTTQYWHSWTGNPADLQRDYIRELGIQPNTLVKPPTLLAFMLEGKTTPSNSNILVRREVVDDVGGFEEAFRGIFEDQVFLAKVCLRVPVFVSNECWDRYRQHPDSCCAVATKTGQRDFTRLFYLDWLEGYLSVQGVKDAEVWKALQEKRWRHRQPVLYHLSGQKYRVGQMKGLLKHVARLTLPVPVRRWLRAHLTEWRGELR